jgi:hypothetical protein
MGGRKKSSDLVKEYQKAKEEKAHKSWWARAAQW